MGLSITADELCRITNIQAIENEVKDQLLYIEEQINEAHHKNRSSVAVDLPVVFETDAASEADLQIMIYGQIIEELETKKFTVNIELFDNATTFFISWPAKLSEEAKDRYTYLIKTRKRKNNKDDL